MTETTTVTREVVVDAPLERAFATFVERFDDFKPRTHNLLDAPIVESVFEPRVGGHVYDRADDGSICRWARVLAYDPPSRLVFSWDIGVQWQLEQDLANASEVEVRFTPAGEGRTRVELEHRHLDRHGPGWPSLRDGVAGERGWPLYLQQYADLVPAAARS